MPLQSITCCLPISYKSFISPKPQTTAVEQFYRKLLRSFQHIGAASEQGQAFVKRNGFFAPKPAVSGRLGQARTLHVLAQPSIFVGKSLLNAFKQMTLKGIRRIHGTRHNAPFGVVPFFLATTPAKAEPRAMYHSQNHYLCPHHHLPFSIHHLAFAV